MVISDEDEKHFNKSHNKNLGYHFALVMVEKNVRKEKTNFSEISKERIDLRKNSFGLYSLFFLFCTFPCFNMMPN